MDSTRVADFPPEFGWLNTDRPLRWDHDLRGQVVVLDFWTYCCINCIHILPDLAFLEEKYRDEPVTFIGVHSAKFSNEASRETIRAAILRYEIRHPVIIDQEMQLWRAYKVRSWPTVVVVDPRGRLVMSRAGERPRDALDEAISRTLVQSRGDGSLAAGPLRLKGERDVRAASGLSFPGKVCADAGRRLLVVADSNHNRIVIAGWPDEAGRSAVIRVVGEGIVGRVDGSANRSRFHHPQGVTIGRDAVYVADTENHLIRRIDLRSFDVSTVAGTGEMSSDLAGGGRGTQQGLNSPWDLVLEGSTLYVAMAGSHQIWRVELPIGFARALAGTGRENLVDGSTETSAFAQPSGICLGHGALYVADSEVSGIRAIDMATEQVSTIFGEGLFSFGDVDGVYPDAKLQHPLGVTAWGTGLLVADTYNHKIKLVDPHARTARTLWGSGQPGTDRDGGAPAFFEPGGLSCSGDDLLVADTNNHRVVHVHVPTGRWREVVFEGLSAPPSMGRNDPAAIDAGLVRVAPNRDLELILEIGLPKGAHFSSEAPWSLRVTNLERTMIQQTGRSEQPRLHVRLPGSEVDRGGTWRVFAAFAFCTDEGNGLCVPAEAQWSIQIETGGTESSLTLRHTVSEAG